MQAWNIFLLGNYVDTVHYDADMSEERVLSSLINHDGFDNRIYIERR